MPNNKITIKVYPAKNGDSFLLSYGDKLLNHILIDCGYVDTVNKYILQDMIDIAKKDEHLDRLILTHIDEDHIKGAIKLFELNNKEKIIHIDQVWHNAFRHLFQGTEHIDNDKEQIVKRIIRRGYPKDEEQIGEQPISAEQGTTVGALLLEGNYLWNSDFDGKAACIENKREIVLNSDGSIYILSPNHDKLNMLKELWKDELKKWGTNYDNESSVFYDDAFEMLLAWEKEKLSKRPKKISSEINSIEELLEKTFDEDDTATNGSSIAFILRLQDKRMLFLADSHPSLIVKSLEDYQATGKIYFDVIKVAHHGSFCNISKELLEKIDAEVYVFSTNGGRHKHPDLETIAHIIARDSKTKRKLYFNYITESSEYFNRTDWMEKYNYSIRYLNHEPYSIEL